MQRTLVKFIPLRYTFVNGVDLLAWKFATFVAIPKLNCERLKCKSLSDLFT